MQVVSPTHIKLRVYERGAGATLACGSGACAAVVAGVRTGHLSATKPVCVEQAGGRLQIRWSGASATHALDAATQEEPSETNSVAGPSGSPVEPHKGTSEVIMTGPATHVFDGVLACAELT